MIKMLQLIFLNDLGKYIWIGEARVFERPTRRGRARPSWAPACVTPTNSRRCTSPVRGRPRSASSSSSSSPSLSTPRTTMVKTHSSMSHDRAGWRPWRHIEIIKLLLGKRVDVESEGDSGTPLIWAAGHGQDAIKLLLEHNAKHLREQYE